MVPVADIEMLAIVIVGVLTVKRVIIMLIAIGLAYVIPLGLYA